MARLLAGVLVGAMALGAAHASARTIRGTGGKAQEKAHSLLLSRATIRIPLPWPPKDRKGNAKRVEFDLAITPRMDAPGLR